ncbi:MAG: glycosyltransferase [Bryobacteraceae bacterium]|jgi:glycosyltransferase involved in cell wall biosynthesis
MSIRSIIIYTTSSHEYRVPQVRYVAKGLKEAGFETTVAGPLGPKCVQELRELGVHALLKPISPTLRRLRLYLLSRLFDVATDRRNRHDLALGIGSAGLTLAYLAYRLGRAKHLGAYFLEYDPPDCYHRQIRHYPHLLVPRLAANLDVLIDVNDERLEQRRTWMSVPEHSVVLRNVPPGAFVRKISVTDDASRRGPLRFLYQGTLGSGNGLSLLFEAFERIDARLFTLTLAGHSNEPEALAAHIARRFPAGNVHYAGFLSRTDLPEFLSQHHVGIALYPWRDLPPNPGFALCAPNKLYEYFARGLPAVCSDNTSLRFVEDLNLGWRVDPGNPQAFANLIGMLCRERTRVREYGNNALTLCRHEWNFENQFKAVADLIRRT